MIDIQLRGKNFIVHDNEALSNAIRRNKEYWEADILDFMRDRFPQQETIIDVGANIGNHTHYFASYLEYKRIIAFEPEPNNFELLRLNMWDFPRVSFLPFALSNSNGFLNMQLNHENWGAHEVQEEGSFRVPCLRLDTLSYTDITLLKIDAEYHEPEIIKGAAAIISRDFPMILIEDTRDEYESLLNAFGYSVYKRWPHHRTNLYLV